MKLISSSHTKNCTVKNALLWGMCRSHIHQFRTQSKLHSRITHLVLAILEAIPVIGQIVSLIELKIIRCYTSRCQTSLKNLPPTPRIKRRPTPPLIPLSSFVEPPQSPKIISQPSPPIQPRAIPLTPTPSPKIISQPSPPTPPPAISLVNPPSPKIISQHSPPTPPPAISLVDPPSPKIISQPSPPIQPRAIPLTPAPFPKSILKPSPLIQPQAIPSVNPPSPRIIYQPPPPPPVRPQPPSCIPQITTIAFQEELTDLRRIWPSDLKLLGLTEAEKTVVDTHIREAFRAILKGSENGKLSFSKKRLEYTDGFQTVDAALPISLTIFKGPESEFRVLLLSKTIFASGGERKIRWAYDLTKGTFLLKKRVTGIFEENILDNLLPLRKKRDIQTSVIWRNSTDKQNKSKRQMIEPVRDGTLETLFGTAPLSNFSVKLDLIMDLLSDLKDLHGIPLSVTIPSLWEGTLDHEFAYNAFHSDIKSLNVLVFFQNGKWRAELCDFGAGAGNPIAFINSVGFTPPEYIRFYKEKRPFGASRILKRHFDDLEITQFNTKHGQGRDVWSMGLVILSLLVEREQEVAWENVFEHYHRKTNIPPLPCLKAILSGKVLDHYNEKGILDLKQETLDADLDQLEKEMILKCPGNLTDIANIFKMLKEMMLRVDPNERKTIAQCLAFLNPETEQIVEDPDLPPLVDIPPSND